MSKTIAKKKYSPNHMYTITFHCLFCQGGNIPPQDSLDQVHKQAELKRALKMYSVISDGEDVRSRTPSPLENNNDLPNALLYENTARYV